MNANQLTTNAVPADLFGRRVAARLSEGTAGLPYEISERLRAGRTQALVKRKRVAGMQTAVSVSSSGGAATLTGDEKFSFWHLAASALPMLALVAGLVFIHTIQNESRANEVAEVDAALLTDDLPPAAYADAGFIQFLKQTAAKE